MGMEPLEFVMELVEDFFEKEKVMKQGPNATNDEKRVHDMISDSVPEIVCDADPEIALHALTTVIGNIVWELEPEDRMPFMIDVFHMLSHKFES
jgi:hypothetical protein